MPEGRKGAASPPLTITSLTTVEEINEYLCDAGMHTVTVSGCIFLLACAMTDSTARSVVVLSPRMRKYGPF